MLVLKVKFNLLCVTVAGGTFIVFLKISTIECFRLDLAENERFRLSLGISLLNQLLFGYVFLGSPMLLFGYLGKKEENYPASPAN